MSSSAVPLSVVMAVYNGATYLNDSLGSICSQTFSEFEVIIVDDGSIDGTAAMLDEAARRDPRLKVIHQSHCGLAISLNHGLASAVGEYVARHDADDRSLPGRFETQIAFLRSHAAVAAVGTATVALDDAGSAVRYLTNRVGAGAVQDGLRSLRATPVHGSMMLRRAAVAAVGAYRPAFHAAQDVDLWLRLSERFELDNVPDVLYQWRMHASAVSATHRATQLLYAGVASVFARERESYGTDSYALLESCDGDLERFARRYRLRGPLEALWGELLFRGLNDPRVARLHLGRALRAGHLAARTLLLFGWSALGRSWPGGPTLHAVSTRS